MPVVRTSARAFFLAMLPVAIVQAVLLVLSTRFWFEATNLGLAGPDGVITLFAVQIALFGGLMFAGHVSLKHVAVYSRTAYACIGAAAALIAYITAARYGILSSRPMPGTWISSAILPTLAGALSGFLYSQYAGIETLAAAFDHSDPEFTPPGDAMRGRFEGPVRVRSSLGAMALVTFLPALLVGIMAFSLLQFGLTDTPRPLLFALAAQTFLTSMFVTALPALLLILVTHHTARSLGYMRGAQYGGLGAGYAALAALFAGPFTAFTSVTFLIIPAVVSGALMGALYRRFAGLEPVPLPEPVIVTDVESLVPADDPARRGHSILLNG
jgi:hypothetical protein